MIYYKSVQRTLNDLLTRRQAPGAFESKNIIEKKKKKKYIKKNEKITNCYQIYFSHSLNRKKSCEATAERSKKIFKNDNYRDNGSSFRATNCDSMYVI